MTPSPQPTVPQPRGYVNVPVPGLPPRPTPDPGDGPDLAHDPFLPSLGIFLALVGLALVAAIVRTLVKEHRKK